MSALSRPATWLQITSGRGPAECERVVAKVLARIRAEAEPRSVTVEVLSLVPGDQPDTYASALIALRGPKAATFAQEWEGGLQWTGVSPFRPHHPRKNWFISLQAHAAPQSAGWSASDARFATMRARGPGGQNVNKVATAVRLTHAPSGLTVTAREERSQSQNRKLAQERLAALLRLLDEEGEREGEHRRWQQHNTVARGNAKRQERGSLEM